MTFLLDHDVPDDLTYSLHSMGHQSVLLRDVLHKKTGDPEILEFARQKNFVVITCNRDDFLALGRSRPHYGIIILRRKKTRVSERAALVYLLDRLNESDLIGHINFA